MNHKLICISLIFLVFYLPAEDRPEKTSPSIQFVDSTYIVDYSFPTTMPDSQLIDIFFTYTRIVKYLNKINLTLRLIEEKKDYNKIEYTYSYIISRLILTFDRQVNQEERTVNFNVCRSERSNRIIPRVHSITGYYKIVNDTKGRKVVYYQKTTLDRRFNKLYMIIISRATISFLDQLEEYINKMNTAASPEGVQ